MAQGHHQIITQARIYTSYPLFLYASGGMDAVRNYLQGVDNLTDEELYKLILLDPSDITEIPVGDNDNWLAWRILPTEIPHDSVNDINLVFNADNSYAMILGHNLNTANGSTWVTSFDENADGSLSENGLESNVTTIKNYTDWNTVPEYNGWSAWQLGEMPSDTHKYIGIRFKSDDWQDNLKLGSILFGKYFDMPRNADLNQSLDYSYGNRQKTSISGKTISTSSWTKTDNWITEPFGLNNEEHDNPHRKSGRRTWQISYTGLEPKHINNQNMMLNSNGFEAQDNHSTGADGTSLYNAYNGVDFYTNCVKMTMGGHLPMVLCTDRNEPSPSNWAIVRMSKYKITQKSPSLFNFKITLVEQI